MADDPNRDILPVKEGSYVDTCRSSIDPKERHFVCKLDRYQLEDKYLRLLDESSNLKKVLNSQEDKIKRLATKLMRVSVNPRSCAVALDVYEDKNRISALERENSKLKDKVSVLRNQLLNHTIAGRSSSRSRNPLIRPSSGHTTCRSDSSRIKISCRCNNGQAGLGNADDTNLQAYLAKIEDLEAEKKEMSCRISHLEKELSGYAVSNQREKVAENVEYIKVWRQMKQLNDKLLAAEETNKSLNAQIDELKAVLQDTSKNNHEIMTALVEEKKQIAQIDEEMLKAKDSQLAVREKDGQIKDLMNEMKILQQHNGELISLSSKYGQVELENAELRKRVSEQMQDQQSLRSACTEERATIAALQAANERLLDKLQELQAKIDTLTMQLTTFHHRNEQQELSAIEQIRRMQIDQSAGNVREPAVNEEEKCKRCCETYEKILRLEKAVNTRETAKFAERAVQADRSIEESARTKDQGTAMTPVRKKPRWGRVEHEPSNQLSSEEMLKLLAQAQISTPIEAARVSQKEAELDHRQSNGVIVRNLEARLFRDRRDRNGEAVKETMVRRRSANELTTEARQILLNIFNILYKHTQACSEKLLADEAACRPVASVKELTRDVPNGSKKAHGKRKRSQEACSRKRCSRRRSERNNLDGQIFPAGCAKKNSCSKHAREPLPEQTLNLARNWVTRFTETGDCSCVDGRRCYGDSDCGYHCCSVTRAVNSEPRIPNTYDKWKIAGGKDSFPLLIADDQALVEIHILCFQLSTSAREILFPRDEEGSGSLCLNWAIWNQEPTCTRSVEVQQAKLHFNSSFVYRVSDLSGFFNWVLTEYLVFNVNTASGKEEAGTTARAKLSIKDVLDYPQNKLHYIAPVNSAHPTSLGTNLGQLSLWIRLSCDVDRVNTFKRQTGLYGHHDLLPGACHGPEERTTVDSLNDLLVLKERDPGETFAQETSKTHFVDIHGKVSSRLVTSNEQAGLPYLSVDTKLTPEDISMESFGSGNRPEPVLASNVQPVIRAKQFMEMSDPYFNAPRQLSKVEEATVSQEAIDDDNNVFRDEDDTDDQILHPKETPSMAEFHALLAHPLEKNVILIDIVNISLFQNSEVMQDDEIQMLYVEYSFLGHRGAHMETVSVLKPKQPNQKMVYNFRKKFYIDEEQHSLERNTLSAMLDGSIVSNIKFVLVCEPLPEEMDEKECVEVGFAYFNIKEYAMGDGQKILSLPIMNKDQTEQIGVLKIIVLGFEAIHQCLEESEL